MRPLWAEFPDDEGAFDEEREWLVGPGLLVRPVMEPDVKSVSLYLPGRRNVIWYEWNDHKVFLLLTVLICSLNYFMLYKTFL